MNKAFLAFNDRIVASNLLQNSSDLAKELRNTTEHFLTLTKTATSSSSADSGESDTESPNILSAEMARDSPQPQLASITPPDGPRMIDIGMGYVQILEDPVPHGQLTPPTDYADISFPTVPITSQAPNLFQPLGVTSADFTLFPSTTGESNPQVFSNFSNVHMMNDLKRDYQPKSSDNKFPSLIKSMTVPAPYTFSVDEITFARRLQRAGFERAFHLLVKADSRPEAFSRVFRLSLPYHSRDSLIKKVRHILTTTTLGTLDVLHTPFIQLGGAGTHYSVNRSTNSYSVHFGPNRKARLQHVETGLDPGIELDIDMKDYSGEWFDSNDVEGYLLELGMAINPRASFAEAHVSSKGPLMEILRRNGLVNEPEQETNSSAWTPPTGISSVAATTTEQSIPNSLSSQPADNVESDSRFFQELGVPGITTTEDLIWPTNDLVNAAGWLMGSGDKTPEFSSSGWQGYQNPSSWESSDSLTETMRSLTHSPEIVLETTRKITLDVGGLIDCECLHNIIIALANIDRCDFSCDMSWSGARLQEKGCGTGPRNIDN
jgi:hypothetical protein